MDTKEDEEHVGRCLEEMLKTELNVSIQRSSLINDIRLPHTLIEHRWLILEGMKMLSS